MCRFIAYRGEPVRLADILYEPPNSLVHQAVDAMESPTRINADGFGIGWYDFAIRPEPAVFKDVLPAWNDRNLRALSEIVETVCLLAHVRAARRNDPIAQTNCHPFTLGRLLWMHNGDVPGRGRLHRRVVAAMSDELVARIEGSTDTELLFMLLMSALGPAASGPIGSKELVTALRSTIARVMAWHRNDRDARPLVLNLCVTNGRALVASRVARNADPPSLHVCEDVALTLGPRRGARNARTARCSIIASERLWTDVPWTEVQPDHIVVVDEWGAVHSERVEAAA